MKKLIFAIALAGLVSSNAHASWWGGNDGPWDYNDYPVWTPMYWMEEMWGNDDYWDYYGPWGGGPWGGYGAPWAYAPYGNGYGYQPYGYGYGYPAAPAYYPYSSGYPAAPAAAPAAEQE